MQRFAHLAIVVVALGAPATWVAGCHAGHSQGQRVVIAPGEDPSFPIAIEGATVIEIDRTGTLLVHIGDRVTRQPPPRAYQDIAGRRHGVAVHFDIAPSGEPRLVVGPYDRSFPLVIQ